MKVLNHNQNPVGDDFHSVFEDNHDEIIEYLRAELDEQKKANNQSTILAIIALVIATASLIVQFL